MSIQRLGRYELIRVLGKGAMGLVYEGRDPNLDRRVAIKTIKVENLSEEEAAEYEIRFRTEARSAARLQHPNIVSVYDSDRDVDIAYLVMEFIQGDDLKHYLDKGDRYTLQQAVSIMNDLLSALDYAHRQNIVHRDIKPANLLIEASGRIKLTDFGVARIQDSGEATRTKGTMVGTLKYMSPEQVHGLPIDARSDLFSAGIVLYQLLTGARPFDGTGDYEIIQKIIGQAAEPPSTFNPNLPPEIDQVVARALEKSRDDRYPTAQEFNSALQAAAGSAADPTITPPASWPRPADSATWTSTVVKGESLVNTNSGSLSGLPSSTVTQEVELVYWKEIKDSVDVEEFQDFLTKFPSGIYSDLARRRLKRLANPGNESSGSRSGTRTQLMTAKPVTADLASDDAASKKPAATADARTAEFEATRISVRPTGETAEPNAIEAPAPAKQSSGTDDALRKVRQSLTVNRRGWIMALAGMVALGGIGFGYQRLTRTNAPEPAAIGQAAVGQTAAEPPKEAVLTKPPVPVTVPRASQSTPPSAAPKAVTAKAAPKAPAKAAASPAPAVAKTSSPSPKTEQKPVAPEVANTAAIDDPTKECEGRVLLGYLFCMKDQCDKPKYEQHPVCVERRAMEQRNRGSLDRSGQ